MRIFSGLTILRGLLTVAVTENVHFRDPAIPGEGLVQDCPCSVADDSRVGPHEQDPTIGTHMSCLCNVTHGAHNHTGT